MTRETRSIETSQLLGGRLCLEFVNTADWHSSELPEERLVDFTALVRWSQRVGILNDFAAQRLLDIAAAHPEDADRQLAQAIVLREALFGIFRALAHGRALNPPDLECFNFQLAVHYGRARLRPVGPKFQWEWGDADDRLDCMLSWVVHDAAALLTSEDISRVRECQDGRCGWLFLDTSRNRSRRWCSMQDCGNRAKAQRHYRRNKLRSSG